MSSHDLDQEKAFIRRRIISWWDFVHTCSFLDRFLALRDEEDKSTKNERVALTIAAVVSYCRPFSGNEDVDGTRWRLPDDVRSDFSDPEELAHVWMMKLRHKAFAHSDTEMMGMEILVQEVEGELILNPLSWSQMEPMSYRMAKRLRGMAERLARHVSEDWNLAFERVKDELSPGDVF